MGWTETTLGNLITFQRGFDLPAKNRIPGDVPVLAAGEKTFSHNEAKVAGPGFVIGRSTNLGVPRWSDTDFWPLNTTLFAKDFKGNNPRWLFYLFKTLDLSGFDSGTAQGSLNRNYISAFKVSAPDRDRQDRIVDVLGSLDDKIAANNRVVSISNELVRARYSALPVSACSLRDIADLVRSSTPPHGFDPQKRLVGLEHFDSESLWLARSSTPDVATSAKNEFHAGDTLFGKLRPYFHKVAIAPFEGYCSTDVLVLRAKEQRLGPLVAAAANSDAVVQHAVNSSNGTRMPRAKWGDIETCQVPDPGDRRTAEFIRIADTLIQDATARLEANATLANTRDELLPLLMNGKISVREAEQEATSAGADIPSEEIGA